MTTRLKLIALYMDNRRTCVYLINVNVIYNQAITALICSYSNRKSTQKPQVCNEERRSTLLCFTFIYSSCYAKCQVAKYFENGHTRNLIAASEQFDVLM